MHDQKLLTLRWRLFCHGCIHNMQSLHVSQFVIHVVLAAFLAWSFPFFLISTLFFNNTEICIIIISKIPSFGQCLLSVAGLVNLLLLSSKWMLAALPHHRECTNFHQSAYLDQNRDRAQYPHHLRNIPHREELYANTYIQPANWLFQHIELLKSYRLGWVACLPDVELALDSALCVGRVEVHLFLCVSTVSADSLRCHFGSEGSRTCGFDKALPGVFVSQPSPFCAPETQHPDSLLLRPRWVISLWDISFARLRRVKSLVWPFWPYSMPGACRTVPAVPDLLALP